MISRREFLAAAAALPQATRDGALLYIGAFPGRVLVFDEDQERVVDSIPLHTGVPRGVRLSYDKKKIYFNTPVKNGIEVLDLATRKITNYFVLDEANRRVAVQGYGPDPQDKLLYGRIRVSIRQIDRFEIEKPKFAVIDLAEKRIVKTVDLPMESGKPINTGDLRVTPDGKFLYSFAEHVRIFDTADFKEVDKIELYKPPYPGMDRINLNTREDPTEPRDIVTGIFNSVDPIVRRAVFGIARFDLNKRTFEFTPVGPSAQAGIMGLQMTPDRKTGYTVAFQGEHGNRRTEFWVFDMPSRKVVKRIEFDGPINFGFTLSGNGKLIYLHGTAPTMEIYDAATLQRRKVVELDADMTTRPLVVPRGVS